MKRALPLVLALAWLSGIGLAKSLTLFTKYGPLAANADRVMVSGEDGRWYEAAGSDGTYLIELEGSRFSLVVTCFSPEGPDVTVYRFLAAELDELRHVCAGSGDLLTARTHVTGEVSTGAKTETPEHRLVVQYGAQVLYVGPAHEGASFIASVGVGTADLLALYGPRGAPPTAARLQRDLAMPEGAALEFDFAEGGGAQLEQHALTVKEAEHASLAARLVTCSGLSADVGAVAPAGRPVLQYGVLPEDLARECDRYELTAFHLAPDGVTVRLASVSLAAPGDLELELPAPVGLPAIETVGTDPLRARLSWQSDPGVLFYLGGLTDGRVRWSFVQSAWLAPSITLPPWGADVGAPGLRGGAFSWTFGAVQSAGALGEAVHAYAQHSVTGQGQFWQSVTAGLEHQVFLTGGHWAPHASELPGSR